MSIDFIDADWPVTHIGGGTTTRAGGVSRGSFESLNLGAHVGDHAAAVRENRRRLRAELDLPGEPLWLNQVHGTRIAYADDLPGGGAPPTADASVSCDGRRVLGILTADCLPVLLCSSVRDGYAAVHCGWRSLSGGIVAETVAALASDPGELLAWLGPAISGAAFEVGDEVRDIFLAGVEGAAGCFEANRNDRWQADLYGLARLYLGAAGVKRVYGGCFCTYGDRRRFFSYRRDGRTGRMATLIWPRQGSRRQRKP